MAIRARLASHALAALVAVGCGGEGDATSGAELQTDLAGAASRGSEDEGNVSYGRSAITMDAPAGVITLADGRMIAQRLEAGVTAGRIEFPSFHPAYSDPGDLSSGLAVFQGEAGTCANLETFGRGNGSGQLGHLAAWASNDQTRLAMVTEGPGAEAFPQIDAWQTPAHAHVMATRPMAEIGMVMPAEPEVAPFFVLTSPNWTRFKVSVTDAGTLVVEPM